MNTILTILTILIITCIGYGILKIGAFLPKTGTLKTIAYSYGLGAAVVALQVYFYSRISIPLEKHLLLYPWIIFILFILVKYKAAFHFVLPRFSLKDKFALFLIGGILFFLGYTLFEALIRPVTVWDAWVVWLFKAKIFFIDKTVNPQSFSYIDAGYPILMSLLPAFVYFMLGVVDDSAVLLLSSAYFIFLALLFYALLKQKFGLRYALLFTFLFVSIQNFIRHGGRLEAGIADLPLGFYSFVCTILLFDYIQQSNKRILLLLTIFMGITSLIKYEGIPIVAIISCFILIHIYKKKLFKHLLIVWLWVLPVIDWQIYKKIHNFQTAYFTDHGLVISVTKAKNAIWGTMSELFNIKTWSLSWVAYFYTLIVYGIKKSQELFILHVLILSQLLLYILMYIFTSASDPESSVERLLIHIAPLAIYAVAITLPRTEFPLKSILLKKG